MVKDLPDPSEYGCMGDDDLWLGVFGYCAYLCDGSIEELVTGLAFVTLQGIDPQSESFGEDISLTPVSSYHPIP